MSYDASNLAMLRAVLDQILVSENFTSQRNFAAADVAQHILHLAAQGERDVPTIKREVFRLLSMSDPASVEAALVALFNSQHDRPRMRGTKPEISS